MKKTLILLFFFTILALSVTKPTQAHFLARDGNLGAILHIDPNDSPIAGSLASFFFEFKDKENKFKLKNCDCTFEIEKNGKNIYSQSLSQNNTNPNLNYASMTYTFPQIAVYQINIIGRPLTPHTFESFTLTWNFRVDQQASTQTEPTQNSTNFFSRHLIDSILIGILLIGSFIYVISNKRMNKKHAMKGGEKKNEKKDSDNIY
ncbi:MAG TPA: hypothetical protein VNW29_07840 [Candidatus Sulfotelmatobacter sp.]|jgi:hypothetical protein|nr:hypothetical protein [Candidatus Sulfotelmatobacter sp.]